MVTCPIECVKDNPDFIERNGAWLLSVIASSSALFGYPLSYLLKSRCKKIDCWGLKCDRTPIDLDSVKHRLWIRQVRAQTCIVSALVCCVDFGSMISSSDSLLSCFIGFF